MKDNLLTIFHSTTFRQSALTTSATVVNGLLGVIFYPLVARLTGVSDFGAFSISILTITLLSDIANFGTDTGIVRFVGKYIQSDRHKAYQYLKFALKFKIIVALFVLIVGIVFAPTAATLIFHKPELTVPLQMAVIGGALMLLFSFTTSAMQAIQKFEMWSILNICLNTLRLSCVVSLSVLGVFTLERAIGVYALIPFIGFLVALFLLPKFWKVKQENSVAQEFFHYNKWVGVFILIAALSSRLDSFLTTRFLSLQDVGIYSAAVSLSSVGPQVVSAIATVVAPKLSGFDSPASLLKYLKKLQFFLVTLAFCGTVTAIIASFIVIPLLFGDQFTKSIQPFIVLVLAQAIFLISIPIHTTIMYYLAKPIVFVYTSFIHLGIIYFGGIYLISTYGYMGAAYTVLLGTIANFFFPAMYFVHKIKHEIN